MSALEPFACARFICTICIHTGSADFCEGLTSILQQLILDTFEVIITETYAKLVGTKSICCNRVFCLETYSVRSGNIV